MAVFLIASWIWLVRGVREGTTRQCLPVPGHHTPSACIRGGVEMMMVVMAMVTF